MHGVRDNYPMQTVLIMGLGTLLGLTFNANGYLLFGYIIASVALMTFTAVRFGWLAMPLPQELRTSIAHPIMRAIVGSATALFASVSGLAIAFKMLGQLSNDLTYGHLGLTILLTGCMVAALDRPLRPLNDLEEHARDT